jgi:hypothetical protein
MSYPALDLTTHSGKNQIDAAGTGFVLAPLAWGNCTLLYFALWYAGELHRKSQAFRTAIIPAQTPFS